MKSKQSKEKRKKKQLQISDVDLMSLDYDTVFFQFRTLDGEIIFIEMYQN